MRVPIIMPELGMPCATLGLWFVDKGESVDEGERLIEIRAGAATFDISAPAGGRLVNRCAFPSDSVAAGQVLGYIEKHVTEF
jgi:pyruvate/2-oxoglutarate dehydrogenase complex dihydrolipoamide acyltransferase (E2) component